jgi:hypothetical protein
MTRKTATPACVLIPTLGSLTRRWELEGFRPGLPRGLTDESLKIDLRVARAMICPACGRRSMLLHCFTDKGQIGYRALAACLSDGAAEVL